MPFNELQRRDSWPPTVVRLPASNQEIPLDLSNIDEDPISFFLTSAEEADFFDDDIDDDLSAGIETNSTKPIVREISPSSLQRAAREKSSDDDEEEDEREEYVEFGLAMPLSLKDFTARTITTEKSTSPSPQGLGISHLAFPPSRGRAKIRLTPNNRGRSQTRSLSARRNQSWRVPSPDIYSIEEEIEEGSPKKEKKAEDVVFSASAPVTSQIKQAGVMRKENGKGKAKKRVHWAF